MWSFRAVLSLFTAVRCQKKWTEEKTFDQEQAAVCTRLQLQSQQHRQGASYSPCRTLLLQPIVARITVRWQLPLAPD